MIDHETIQRIMDAARIEEVVGDFVSLKKRGANHIGCCPFHNEKTPSFYVSPSKGIYKCFGCGEAGDVVKFLMKHEHYSYPEALQYLAKKYHIEVQEQEMTPEQKERQSERDALFHVTEFAQKHFADLLYNDEMGRAVGLSYFHQRGLTDDIIRRFGLGYCLDEWSAFTDLALAGGYSLAVLEKTGLTIVKEDTGKRYDRFRGRVMFPIYSISGRVLGFSGRVLSSEKQAAKYVNSPDSDIYNKSRTLYGLFQARAAIAKADKCYLVEGNVDVVSMHQSGVENTVASCGTSLTVEQIRLIKRYTPNVTVLYDGDSAGIKAALRAVNLLFGEGMHVRIVLFPDGEDPDSYAQKYGSTQLQDYLATHEDNFVMFKTRVLLDGVKDDPIRKAGLVKETVETIALVPDLIERTEYVRQCSRLLGVPEATLTAELKKAIDRMRQQHYEQQRRDEAANAAAAAAATPLADEPAPAPATPAPAPPAPAQPPAAVTAMPVRSEERRLVSLLVNYGDSEVPQTVTDEQGVSQTYNYTVAELVVSDLQQDGAQFTDPRCSAIYDLFARAVDEGRNVESEELATLADPEARQLAISLMLDTYSISAEAWKKRNVYVPTIAQTLPNVLLDTVMNYKLRLVRDRALAVDDKLRRLDPSDAEAAIALLKEKKKLKEAECEIGSKLNRVII